MINATQSKIEAAAHDAGWDSYTLLLVISQWLEANSYADALVSHLEEMAGDEEKIINPAGLAMSPADIKAAAFDAGYTVNQKETGEWVFNDPDGNDADNGPWHNQEAAWAAAYADIDGGSDEEDED